MSSSSNPFESADAPGMGRSLLDWARGRRAHLPWRGENDPYRIWVSEVMLQQTRVETVAPYYGRFLARFPTVQHLAAASLDEVLCVWEGLGYYGRARSLHSAAREVVTRFGGALPASVAGLRSLPGFGEYTAGAVASLAFGIAEPALDGNGLRVLARLAAVDGSVKEPGVRRQLNALARSLLPADAPGDFNAGLMDLGAQVCRPRCPNCPACPWQEWCRARATGRQEEIPSAAPRKALPHHTMVAGLIVNQGRVLAARRRAAGLLGGLWALPGGRVAPGETPTEALVRTVREGAGVEIRPGEEVGVVEHAYTHFRITLHGLRAEWVSGEAEALGYDAVRWVAPAELAALGFAVTDRRLLRLGLEAEAAGGALP